MASRWRTRRASGAEGFTLVELLVAMTLFALFSASMLPLVVTALRAGTIAKLDTGARNITQERIEKLRTLPFHVDQAAGAGLDLLDIYYPSSLTPAASKSTAGYVSPAAAREAYEPTGAFYRYLVPLAEIAPDAASAAHFSKYTQRVALQFLSSVNAPVTPVGWRSLVGPGDELLPARLVRAVVTTTWAVGNLSKRYSVTTEIVGTDDSAPVARASISATALRVTTSFPVAGVAADLLFEAGYANAEGQVAKGSKVGASTRAASASLVGGQRRDGAAGSSSSPADGSSINGANDVLILTGAAGEELVRFGAGTATAFATKTSDGQMHAGTTASPVTASLKTSLGDKFGLDTRPNLVGSNLGLAPGQPVAQVVDVSGEKATGKVNLDSVGGATTHKVTVTGQATTPVVAVMSTPEATNGLLQLELSTSTLSCTSGIGAVDPSLTYTARYRYWMADAVPADYSPWTNLVASQSSDPLAAFFATAASKVARVVPVTGELVTYDKYFTSMRSTTASGLAAQRKKSATLAEANHPAVIQVSTVSTRSDIEAPVTVELGRLTCVAEDRR